MEVLVSVVNEEQAEQAAKSGATWVDLKNPSLGPLGLADEHRQQAFLQRMAVWPQVCRSVALGELVQAVGEGPWPTLLPGFQFAKLGTSDLPAARTSAGEPTDWWRHWNRWRAHLPAGCCGVLVAYADADLCHGLRISAALALAAEQGLPFLLVDTYDKSGGGLFAALDRQGLRNQVPNWIRTARRQGTRIAWAGQLTWEDLRQLRAWDADIVGVRSAICRLDSQGQPDRQGDLCPDRLAQVLTLNDGPDQVSIGRTT